MPRLVLQTEEAPEQPKTLADVEPYFVCEVDMAGRKRLAWRTQHGAMLTTNEDGHPYVSGNSPSYAKVVRVIGPIRLTVED